MPSYFKKSNNKSTSFTTSYKFVSRLFNRLVILPLTLPLCLVLVLGVNGVKAQIYVNTFTGASACPTNGNTPTMASNSTGTAVSRTTITCNSTANVFNSTTLNNTSSISNTSYIQFSATANSGFILNLTSVSFIRQGSNTAPNQMEVRYSTDGFSTSTTWGSAPVTPTSGTLATWNFADFSTGNGGTVTFRIYPYGTTRCDLSASAASAGGTFRIDDVTINGTVSAASPSITIGGSTSATATAFTTTYGTASTDQSFTIAGSNLTAGISVAAVTGFEYSIDGGSTWGTTRTITQSGGSASATLKVRLAATATVSGSYNSQSINLSSTGATTRTISTASSGNTVSKKALSITAANQSVAYGTAVATVTGNGSYTPTGFVNSETSSVIGGSATYTTTYTTTTNAGSNVATITPVTTSLTATNYSFTAANGNISVTAIVPSAPSITGITPANTQLSVAFSAPSSNGGASITNYEYSINGGGNWTTPSPAVTTSPFTISGLTNGSTYDVQIRAVNSAGSGTATGTTQGTPAAPSSPTISGAATATAFTTTYGTASAPQSFSVSGSALTGDITATAPTGFVVSSDGSSYNSTATFTQSGGSASGTLYVKLAATATVSGTYNSQNIVLSSTGASSVNVTTAASGNSVSAKGLTITGISISNKTYDAITTATISGTAAYSGLVNGETFSVTGTPNATFTDKNVANGKSVTLVDYTAPSGNYSISQPTGLTANITAATLTLTGASVTTKTYDGTTAATITGTISGVISSDVVTLNGTGTFASANVGTGISVTSTSTLGGADAGNYSLTQPTGLTGQITLKSLTITATDVSKEMGVLLTGGTGSTAFTSSGLAGSETIGSVTITYGAAAGTTGQGATAGTYSGQVTPSAATGGTFNAANYSITYSSGSISVSGFTAGNLVINRIGNGSTALGNTASSINVLELNTSGITQQTISTLFTGSNLLTETGSGTSNGYLNSFNTSLSVPGYNTALTTAGVAALNTKATNILGTGATVINRVVFPTSGSPLPFTANNFRSIIPTSATTFYASGAGSSSTGGIWYYNGTSYTQVSTTQTNTRNVEIFNGNLYYSTGSGTTGIYQVGSGLPTASGQTATLIAAATSPYGFSISPDGNTMYVADDAAVSGNTGGGIQKWTKSGGTWTRQYTFAVQARGIMVDYSGSDAVIYATTTETSNNKIIKITDTGSGATSSDVLLAGSNYVFRGVDFSPAAAPSAPTIGTLTQTTCASATGSVELTGLPSGQWRIYGFPSGSAVGTGSSTTISGLAAGTYTFIVTSYTGRTSSASASATISTQPGAPGYPTAPTAAAQSFCSSASPTVADLTVTSGSSIKWYDASTNGNLVASGTSLTAGTYYASQTVSECESTTRTSVSVTVNANGTWIGDSNDDWNDANNWCGGIPNSNSVVVSIPSGVTVNLDTSPSVSELTIASTSVINAGSNTITIANGGTFTNNGTFNSQTGTVAFSGTGTLNGNATTFNNLTVNGALSVNTSPTVNGTVTINAGGSVTSNSIIYGNAATLVYNTGGSISSTNNEWPTSNSPRNVTIQNTSNITLNGNKDIIGTLTMTSGDIITGSNRITLGNSSANTGTLNYTSGKIIGELRRYFANATGTNYSFPVGNEIYKRGVTINFTQAPGVDQYLTVAYRSGEPVLVGQTQALYSGLPFTTADGQLIQNYSNEGYWEINPTAYDQNIDIKNYQITLEMNNIGGVNDYNKTRLIRAKGPSHTTWQALTHISSIGSNSNYSITASGNGFSWFAGGGDDNNNPLPVELLSFSGNCENDQTQLTWKTASENNSDYFEVLKSQDGQNWRVINTQAAAGFSTTLQTYSYTELEKSNEAYYRLNQVDINGNYKLYDPIYVDCNESDNKFETYPNPSSNGFNIALNDSKLKGEAVIVIRDAMGKVILEKSIFVEEGINLYPVASIELENGVYFITIEGKQAQSKLIKHIKN